MAQAHQTTGGVASSWFDIKVLLEIQALSASILANLMRPAKSWKLLLSVERNLDVRARLQPFSRGHDLRATHLGPHIKEIEWPS